MNENITDISIKDYLEGIGIPTRKEGNRYFASSPFSRDSNWSFVIYPTNTYFDFSTGHGGNIINLVSRINNISLSDSAAILKAGIKYEKYKPNYKKVKEELFKEVEFNLKKYINHNEEEIAQIRAYAKSRRITDGYFPGLFFTRALDKSVLPNGWLRVPALGFLHVDKNLKPCGAKFRKIIQEHPTDQSPRFSARGTLNIFVTNMEDFHQLNKYPVVYVVEGEVNALSLKYYLEEIGTRGAVVSFGAVTNSTKSVEDLASLVGNRKVKLIIDYDGNEELYQQRLRLYKGLDAQPIKLILPKGEDINSLYMKNEMWKVDRLLLE